jgi:hypothetical protein
MRAFPAIISPGMNTSSEYRIVVRAGSGLASPTTGWSVIEPKTEAGGVDVTVEQQSRACTVRTFRR